MATRKQLATRRYAPLHEAVMAALHNFSNDEGWVAAMNDPYISRELDKLMRCIAKEAVGYDESENIDQWLDALLKAAEHRGMSGTAEKKPALAATLREAAAARVPPPAERMNKEDSFNIYCAVLNAMRYYKYRIPPRYEGSREDECPISALECAYPGELRGSTTAHLLKIVDYVLLEKAGLNCIDEINDAYRDLAATADKPYCREKDGTPFANPTKRVMLAIQPDILNAGRQAARGQNASPNR